MLKKGSYYVLTCKNSGAVYAAKPTFHNVRQEERVLDRVAAHYLSIIRGGQSSQGWAATV